MCGLVEHRAQQGVATFGHPAVVVGLAGLVTLGRQADMRADRPGMDEALRLVHRRAVGLLTTLNPPKGAKCQTLTTRSYRGKFLIPERRGCRPLDCDGVSRHVTANGG